MNIPLYSAYVSDVPPQHILTPNHQMWVQFLVLVHFRNFSKWIRSGL